MGKLSSFVVGIYVAMLGFVVPWPYAGIFLMVGGVLIGGVREENEGV